MTPCPAAEKGLVTSEWLGVGPSTARDKHRTKLILLKVGMVFIMILIEHVLLRRQRSDSYVEGCQRRSNAR